MREDLIADIITFIKVYFKNYKPSGRVQMFDCRNTVGDILHEIWADPISKVSVEYCPDYEYVEIFGLTDEEFRFIDSRVGVRLFE